MLGFDPRSLPEKLLGAAVNLLIAAVALYFAVRLITHIWHALAVIGGVVLALTAVIAAVRWWLHRRRSW